MFCISWQVTNHSLLPKVLSKSLQKQTKYVRTIALSLNGLGKDAAQIISRINGFTYVQTEFDYFTGELSVVREIAYSTVLVQKLKCYGMMMFA